MNLTVLGLFKEWILAHYFAPAFDRHNLKRATPGADLSELQQAGAKGKSPFV